jgi:hypothetical protein
VKVSTVDLIVRLHKTERQGIFTGVVLEPGLRDAHDDVFSAPEIEATAHQFMRDYALAKHEHSPDVEHQGRDAGAEMLENFCAPCDLTIAGEPVRAGAWLQTWLVSDPLTKSEIEDGRLTGLSLEGTGYRRPLTGGVPNA